MRVTLRRPKAMLTRRRSARSRNGSFSASHWTAGSGEAGVEQPVAADGEHRAVDVGEHDLAARADAVGEQAREVAGAAGEVEHARARRARRSR